MIIYRKFLASRYSVIRMQVQNDGRATKTFIPFQEEQSNMNPDET